LELVNVQVAALVNVSTSKVIVFDDGGEWLLRLVKCTAVATTAAAAVGGADAAASRGLMLDLADESRCRSPL
jgi:hypothetical protein